MKNFEMESFLKVLSFIPFYNFFMGFVDLVRTSKVDKYLRQASSQLELKYSPIGYF